MLIRFSSFVFRDQAEQEKLPIGEPSLRGRTTFGGEVWRPHDFCYTSREESGSFGASSWRFWRERNAVRRLAQYDKPNLTVTLRQVAPRGYYVQRDLC